MAELPEVWSVPVVRANFTDDAVWDRIREQILEPTAEGFGADVDFVEDRTLAGLDEAAIGAGYPRAYPREYRHPVLFVIDSVAITTPGHPVLVVNLNARVDAPPFRALPRQVQGIQNNPAASPEEITFRRCPSCGARNIVRDGDFVCALCDSALPTSWNFVAG
jgi:hypothetical protein